MRLYRDAWSTKHKIRMWISLLETQSLQNKFLGKDFVALQTVVFLCSRNGDKAPFIHQYVKVIDCICLYILNIAMSEQASICLTYFLLGMV